MRVVDSGVIVEVLSGNLPASHLGTEPLAAPHLLDSEVLNVLRGLTLGRVIGEADAVVLLRAFEALEIARFSALGLHRRIWELRHNVSAYDATYVALTESLGATELLTTDARLAKAVGPRCAVTLVNS
jgi:predicted nucleic acid-binding protein